MARELLQQEALAYSDAKLSVKNNIDSIKAYCFSCCVYACLVIASAAYHVQSDYSITQVSKCFLLSKSPGPPA